MQTNQNALWLNQESIISYVDRIFQVHWRRSAEIAPRILINDRHGNFQLILSCESLSRELEEECRIRNNLTIWYNSSSLPIPSFSSVQWPTAVDPTMILSLNHPWMFARSRHRCDRPVRLYSFCLWREWSVSSTTTLGECLISELKKNINNKFDLY